MKNCGHDKTNYQNVMYMAITLNLKMLYSISVVHIQRHPVTMYDTRHIKPISNNLPRNQNLHLKEEKLIVQLNIRV